MQAARATAGSRLTVPGARAGTRYRFRIDGEIEVPDPASRFQPDDVHGPSEVVDPRLSTGRRATGRGRPWHECVFLEAARRHVHAAKARFAASIDKLDHLAATGVTAIELMPVADFPARGTGATTACCCSRPTAPMAARTTSRRWSTPRMQRGLMVFLDVVYNHFGPDGNYLGRYCAAVLHAGADTPWGSAIDYETSRRCGASPSRTRSTGSTISASTACGSTRCTPSPSPAAHAASRAERGVLARSPPQTGRHIHLVLENDANQASLLDPLADPPRGKYRAQWNDDYHHAFHVLLTGETAGYYARLPRTASRHLGARAGRRASPIRASRRRTATAQPRGEADGRAAAPTAFVNFLQNHDQIGNRAFGERLPTLAPPAALEAALAVTLLAPASAADVHGRRMGRARAVPVLLRLQGRSRRRPCARAGGASSPRPRRSTATTSPIRSRRKPFRLATLDWAAIERPEHAARLDAGARSARGAQKLSHARACRSSAGPRPRGDSTMTACSTARWNFRTGETLAILANLGGRIAPRPATSGPASRSGAAHRRNSCRPGRSTRAIEAR